jgi:hypothetical protein
MSEDPPVAQSQRRTLAGQEAMSFAPTRTPLWAWPARLVGRVHPALRPVLVDDIRFFKAIPFPGAGLLLVLAAALLAVVPIALHPSGPIHGPLTWLDVYTESLLFMALALLLGLISPAFGIWLVLFHALSYVPDVAHGVGLIAHLQRPINEQVFFVLGRVVSFWLLWLLVVEIPLGARAMDLRARFSRFSRGPLRRVLSGEVVAAFATGTLVFIWTQAMPVLIRPVFTWRPLADSLPSTAAIIPLQSYGYFLVAAAVVMTLGIHAVRDRLAPPAPPFIAMPNETPREALARGIITAPLLVMTLGGVIIGYLDIVVLLVSLIFARPLALWVLPFTGLAPLLVRIHPFLRFLAGVLITYLIGTFINGAAYVGVHPPFLLSPFFPLVLTIALGLPVIEFLVRADAVVDVRRNRPAEILGPGTALALVATALVLLAVPSPVLADNCASLHDCWNTFTGAAAAAAGAAGAFFSSGAWWTAAKKMAGGAPFQVETERAVSGVRG